MEFELLRSIYNTLRNVHDLSLKNFSKKTAEHGVTPTQFGMLRWIPVQGVTTMSDLIRKVGCAPSNMTTMIQRLERDEMVKTMKNPEDHRETLVSLTDLGREKREHLEPMYASYLAECFGTLEREEQESLRVILEKLEKQLTRD